MPAPCDIPPVLAEAFVRLRASRPCHVLVDLIQVVLSTKGNTWPDPTGSGSDSDSDSDPDSDADPMEEGA